MPTRLTLTHKNRERTHINEISVNCVVICMRLVMKHVIYSMIECHPLTYRVSFSGQYYVLFSEAT